MKWLRWLRWTLGFIVVCVALAFGLAWWALRQSLPQLDGTANAPALGAEAAIERDARGIPVISAATRADLAYALGYAHAQDRFFQMDLSRRLAAGELSELFGALAIRQDTRTRRFGFRAVARRVIEGTPEGERAIIDAYTQRRERGARFACGAALGIPAAARAAARLAAGGFGAGGALHVVAVAVRHVARRDREAPAGACLGRAQ